MLRWTLGCTCLFQIWFPWCVCPGVGLPGQTVLNLELNHWQMWPSDLSPHITEGLVTLKFTVGSGNIVCKMNFFENPIWICSNCIFPGVARWKWYTKNSRPSKMGLCPWRDERKQSWVNCLYLNAILLAFHYLYSILYIYIYWEL